MSDLPDLPPHPADTVENDTRGHVVVRTAWDGGHVYGNASVRTAALIRRAAVRARCLRWVP